MSNENEMELEPTTDVTTGAEIPKPSLSDTSLNPVTIKRTSLPTSGLTTSSSTSSLTSSSISAQKQPGEIDNTECIGDETCPSFDDGEVREVMDGTSGTTEVEDASVDDDGLQSRCEKDQEDYQEDGLLGNDSEDASAHLHGGSPDRFDDAEQPEELLMMNDEMKSNVKKDTLFTKEIKSRRENKNSTSSAKEPEGNVIKQKRSNKSKSKIKTQKDGQSSSSRRNRLRDSRNLDRDRTKGNSTQAKKQYQDKSSSLPADRKDTDKSNEMATSKDKMNIQEDGESRQRISGERSGNELSMDSSVEKVDVNDSDETSGRNSVVADETPTGDRPDKDGRVIESPSRSADGDDVTSQSQQGAASVSPAVSPERNEESFLLEHDDSSSRISGQDITLPTDRESILSHLSDRDAVTSRDGLSPTVSPKLNKGSPQADHAAVTLRFADRDAVTSHTERHIVTPQGSPRRNGESRDTMSRRAKKGGDQSNSRQLASSRRRHRIIDQRRNWAQGNMSDSVSVSSSVGGGGGAPQQTPTYSRLLALSLRGEWGSVETLLRGVEKGDPEVTITDEDTGMSPLMLAVKDNKLVVAERLLELGANINERAKDGRAPIHFAASSAKDDMMKLMVLKKADATVSGGVQQQLPLHMAATRSSGGLTLVQHLLRISGREARLAKDADGSIPLFLAVQASNIAVCKELLSNFKEDQLKHSRDEDGDTVLHLACRKKDLDIIKLFVDNGSPVDIQNQDGHTPLHISAMSGDENALKFLYQMKANPNIYDKLDRSPLHIAAESGNTGVVELLVDKFKANVSARTKDGSTLMHIASQCGHPETALAFLKKGVPLHMPNKAGAVCLHAAAKRGHTGVVKALLQKGASVDARTKDNYTALHIAVQHCKPLVVQVLLGHGAQVQLKGGKAEETPLHIAARIKEGEKVAEMLLKSGADVNATMTNGETAMHIACRHGHIKMIQALLEDGADAVCLSKSGENPIHIAVRHSHYPIVKLLTDFLHNDLSRLDAVMAVNEQSVEGETPLHYAAEITSERTHYPGEDADIMKLLLDYESDINIITKLTHETPLHYCARAGNANILLKMVEHLGPNMTQLAVNKQSKNGWSPLLVASEEGHEESVRILLQQNARVDVFDEHGKAALHLAAENGHLAVADIMLWHKAFVNAKSKIGVTPLHLAAQRGHNELVNLLIHNHGAAIDALSLAKRTALHLAAQNGKLQVCETLLKLKSDSNAADIHGQTPLHLAAENDHADIVKLFLKHKSELVSMANSDGNTCGHIAASKGSVAVVKELLRFNRSGVCSTKNKTNDSTALHLAAGGGHKEVVRVLLDHGASPTEENADGLSVLHLAAKYGHLGVLEALEGKDGMTVIHLAAKNGHVGVLEALKGKVSWKAPSVKIGLTALHIAAHHGQIDFVREMLLKVPATIRSEPASEHCSIKEIFAQDHGLTPLHLAAHSGHEGLVRLLLNSTGVQPDVPTAQQGTIPLHLAAQNGHTAVVGLLLSKSTTQLHVKDKRGRTGLHQAAAHGHYDMVALLLGQGSDINTCDKNGWTALHFAAKAGYQDVVTLLVESGASPKFETKDGKVPICFSASSNHQGVLSYLMKKDHNTTHLMDDKKFVFDLMVCGRYNNNASIREFVLRSPAPIDTAVKLAKNFRHQSTKEKERARDLLEVSAFCETMAVDLISITSSTTSPGVLLRAVDERNVPFLDVLMECEQKDVVAHPSVQKYLSDVWVGNLNWASWKIILLFFVLVIFPPIWIFFSLPLKHRFNKLPIIKFMTYLVSHIYLIILLILTTVITPFIEDFITNPSLIPTWYEWLLLLWLSGLLVTEITNPGDRQGLGWIRVVILAFSSMACMLHLVAVPFGDDTKRLLIYIRNQFFAWCVLFCFAHILEFLSFHHLFGPWAIIIRDLMKDLVRFMVILLIFLVGFMLHLAAVYQPVYPKATNSTATDNIIQTPADTFEILFFSLFGLVEPEALPAITRHPYFTLTLVKIVFGTYLIVTLIVLINLLIAMMSDTYQRIQAQSDKEWKYGRAQLIRKMNKTSATPSPLNLFTKLYWYFKAAVKHRGKICTAQARELINEEEELDALSDSRSVDMFAQSNWLRNVVRRNTQVAPEEGYLRPNHGGGPVRMETVVDWDSVVYRYVAIKGQEEDIDLGINFDNDERSQGDELTNQNEQTPKTNGIKNNHIG